MILSSQRLPQAIVYKLLLEAENSFNPPLSINIPYTVEEYAQKLSENAHFILCKENDVIVGFTAYYVNFEGRFVYIPQIWVSDLFQRKGIGTSMVDEIIKKVPTEIEFIRLEVRKSNQKAYSFYKKNLYQLIKTENGKCLMEKRITRF